MGIDTTGRIMGMAAGTTARRGRRSPDAGFLAAAYAFATLFLGANVASPLHGPPWAGRRTPLGAGTPG